jgi:hypothetical protein
MQLHLRVFHKMWIKIREVPLYLVVWMSLRQVTLQIGVSRLRDLQKARNHAEVSPVKAVIRLQKTAKSREKHSKKCQMLLFGNALTTRCAKNGQNSPE